jgi:hypothetical protein
MPSAARKTLSLVTVVLAIILLLALAGRAHRPVNPPLLQNQASSEPRFEGMERSRGEREDLVILA